MSAGVNSDTGCLDSRLTEMVLPYVTIGFGSGSDGGSCRGGGRGVSGGSSGASLGGICGGGG